MTQEVNTEDLADFYDLGFLAYLVNETRERITQRMDGGLPSFDQTKESILSQLVELENSLQSRDMPNIQRNMERMSRLSSYRGNIGNTHIGYFRNLCGGVQTFPETSNEVEHRLLEFADLAYPLHLQRDSKEDPLGSIAVTWQHPLREKLHDAVMADTILATLYPTESTHSGPSGMAHRSTGRGGSTQLWMFASSIMTAAWQNCHFANAQPTLDEFALSVLQMVRTLKTALQGRSATVPMRIGLSGLLLPDGIDEIDLQWARVRRADDRDTRITKKTPIDGELHTTDNSGETVKIDYAGNLVLELDVPYKVVIGGLDFEAPWPDGLIQPELVAGPIECLRLALLVSGISENSTAAATWQSVVDPLASAETQGWNDPRQSTNLMPTQLTPHQVEEWKSWSAKIHDHRTDQVGVAIRRILRAVSERKESEDTLIDAVIVWENLFGAAQETTLRVTMSVAWMLGTDAADRSEKVSEYKKIYQHRSDIVHGNAKLKTDKTADYATRAIQISVELMRKVFDDRQDLLRLKTGAERSAVVMLDSF